MGEVLSFFEPTKSLDFIVLEARNSLELYRLGPRVMQITPEVFLIDLNSSRSYWQKVAYSKGVSEEQIIEQTLRQTYGAETIAIFCLHPFQGFLLYYYFKHKDAFGIYYANTKVTENTFRSLTWQHWRAVAKQLASSFEQSKLMTKERKQLFSHLARLQKLMESLGISTIGEMQSVDFEDIQRRTSSFVGYLWKWTFPQKFKDQEKSTQLDFALDVAILDFPWLQLKIKENPLLITNLEYPLSDWGHIKFQLEDNFTKFARKKELQSPYRILEFNWRITLYDLECCEVPIRFKFPVDLLKEQEKDYTTLLVQFEFAFNELNQKLQEKFQDHINCAYIIGWSLEVTQVIYPTPELNTFFDQVDKRQIDLESFQNKLRHPLQRYRVLKVHIPSLNFTLYEDSIQTQQVNPAYLHPFHLLEQPKKIEEEEIIFKRFIERTSSPWWQEGDEVNTYRDYYICEKGKDIIYAFKNYKGEWFQHGIYS